MSNPSDFIVKVRNDRDIVISKPDAGFEVTYRREMYSPMLIAADVLRSGFDEFWLKRGSWLKAKRSPSAGWTNQDRGGASQTSRADRSSDAKP